MALKATIIFMLIFKERMNSGVTAMESVGGNHNTIFMPPYELMSLHYEVIHCDIIISTL
jgi:hypothetical protein